MSIEKKIIENIKKNNLFSGCTGVVLAVSGGSDSMAMLAFFLRNKTLFPFPLSVAHINHNLRPESAEEERFVSDYCRNHGVCCDILSAEIKKNKPDGQSTEEYARTVRYKFFDEIRKKRNFSHIATAHNKNDATETFFLNIIRGAGQNGASGLAVLREDRVARPLLCCDKAEITAYCEETGTPFVTDKSNFENIYTRNALRNEILPLMRKINPSLDEAVARITETASEDEKFFTEAAEKKLSELENIYGEYRHKNEIPLKFLSDIEKPVLSRLIRRFYNRLFGSSHLTYKQTSDIITLLKNGKPSDGVQISENIRVYLGYSSLFFGGNEKPVSLKTAVPLSLGINEMNGFTVELTETTAEKSNIENCISPVFPLFLRSREEGDKITLYKRPRKKIKKIFIDAKIPSSERGTHFVAVNGGNEVVWLRFFGADMKYMPELGKKAIEIRIDGTGIIKDGASVIE